MAPRVLSSFALPDPCAGSPRVPIVPEGQRPNREWHPQALRCGVRDSGGLEQAHLICQAIQRPEIFMSSADDDRRRLRTQGRADAGC